VYRKREFLVYSISYLHIGAAYLVKNKKENKDYIGKKILLGTLQEKE